VPLKILAILVPNVKSKITNLIVPVHLVLLVQEDLVVPVKNQKLVVDRTVNARHKLLVLAANVKIPVPWLIPVDLMLFVPYLIHCLSEP
jgi:hypothetical protein